MSATYIDRGGEITSAPPYVAQDVQFYGFVVPADHDCLQRNLCDRYLNAPCGLPNRFVPATSHVLFAFNSIARLQAEGADADRGGSAEQEFAVWVLILDRDQNRLLWFHPYMIVDVDTALACGREVYGFPKSLGWFTLAHGSEAPARLQVKTMVVDHWGPEAMRQKQPLVTIERVEAPGLVGAAENVFGSIADLAGAAIAQLRAQDPALLRDLGSAALHGQFLTGQVPMVFLKQIRDAVDPQGACVQRVQQADAGATAFHGATIFGDRFSIDIRDVASHPIRADLGLAPGPLQPVLSFWTSFDFRIGACTDLGPPTPREVAPAHPRAVGGAAVPRRRIAVLGGGMSALTAVFDLTNQPDWQDRYDITVYQLGWRLGGKGASGRSDNGRIEEHGLHVWLGFYDNAFRVIKDVYGQLNPNHAAKGPAIADGIFTTWQHAFHKSSAVGVNRQGPDGRWEPQIYDFPENDAEPGATLPPDLLGHVLLLAEWLLHQGVEGRHQAAYQPEDPTSDPDHHEGIAALVAEILDRFALTVGGAVDRIGLALLRTLVLLLRHMTNFGPTEAALEGALGLANRFQDWIARRIRLFTSDPDTLDQLRLIDLAFAIVAGLLRDVMAEHRPLSALHEDFRTWLRAHGAQEDTVALDKNQFLRGLYDFVFAFVDGDSNTPGQASFEAGCALRTVLRMFLTYRGAIFWKMQAGMGDTVFTPLYRLLKKRGVRFEFFHKVTNLGLSADGRLVERIDIDRQATVRDDGAYHPLCRIGQPVGLDCWPSQPRFEQLVEDPAQLGDLESFWNPAKAGTRVLTRAASGVDGFDDVLLGISVGGLPFLTRELAAANPRWQSMLDHQKTVATMALQLWLGGRDLPAGCVTGGAAATALAEPMDTWADMSHLVAKEAWPGPARQWPSTLVYFCGPLPAGPPDPGDAGAPHRAAAAVTAAIEQRLFPAFKDILPAAFVPDAGSELDPRGLIARYQRANINPSDRYVLSVAHSTSHRLRADCSGFANLVLTGDWVDNGFNVGCIEGAVIAGIRAANVIAQAADIDERVMGRDLF